jgi:hypothetical protein
MRIFCGPRDLARGYSVVNRAQVYLLIGRLISLYVPILFHLKDILRSQ